MFPLAPPGHRGLEGDASHVSGWEQLLAVAGPLVGVMLGAALTWGEGRRSWVRGVVGSEIQHRREHYATFTRVLWTYQSRVARALTAVTDRVANPLPPGSPPTSLPFDRAEHLALSDACRDAFADLQMFASIPVQLAARATMEDVTAMNNRLMAFDLTGSAAAQARFHEHHETFMTAVNADLTQINVILYTTVTPLRRALLNKALRRPLPFEVGGPPAVELDP